MELEKQTFGKQRFAGPADTMGRGMDCDLQALLPHHISPIFLADFSGDICFGGTGPLNFLGNQGKMKFLPESFGPGWFSVRNNLHTKETFWGGKFCSPVVLQNPRDGGAWWAAVFGVAQSQTRLKRLSSSSSSSSSAVFGLPDCT